MNQDRNIADLLRTLRDETTTLVREEVALARTELSEKAALLGRNVAFLAVGGLIASSALLLILIGLSTLIGDAFAQRGVSAGVAAFLGFGIVALVAGITSAVLVTKSLNTIAGNSLKPERTVRSLHEDKQWAQEKLT